MRKLICILPLIALTSSISGCSSLKQSVVSINCVSNQETFVELTIDNLVNLIDSKQQFLLEAYSPYCSHCQDLEPILREYSQKNKKVIYRVDLMQIETESEFNEKIGNKYPDIFPDALVPSVSFIANGKLTYHINPNKYDTYAAFATIANKLWIKSNITLVNDKNGFETYRSSHDKYVAFAYNLSDTKSLEIANSYLVTKEIAKAKTPVILLNQASFASDFAEICQYFNSTQTSFMARVENNEITKTIDYSSADGSLINELIANL